jgi:hypothetical protein
MARVTRSKKIAIAEDNTALASQVALPNTPAKSPLADISNEHNTIPSMEEENVEAELKVLKAAYRVAIGVKKGKKSKGKKKGKQGAPAVDPNIQLAIDDDAHAAIAPAKTKKVNTASNQEEVVKESPIEVATETNRQCSQSSIGSLPRHISELSLRDIPKIADSFEGMQKPAGRTTRQQLAKAGQSDILFYEQHQYKISSKDNFMLSVLGGCSDRSSFSSSSGSVTPARVMANHYFFQAEITAKEATTADRAAKYLVQDNITSNNDPTKARPQTEVLSPITPSTVSTKSPAKTLEDVELAAAVKERAASPTSDDDSFVENITCRSPAKPVSRIEDSVEALDQLEDALEAIDQAALAEHIVSPEKQRPKSKAIKDLTNPKATRAKLTKQPLNPKATSMRIKPTSPRETVLKRTKSASFKPPPPHTTEEIKSAQPPKKAPTKRPISLLPPKEPVKSTKPATLPTKFELPGEAVARRLKEQREARQAQRESSEENIRSAQGPRIKSVKPATKSAFELPGEAISRRKKEAHEARLKAQEEENRKRREFKARPIRQSLVPNMIPRDTAASRARQSKIGLENMDSGSLNVAKRSSNVGAHRPSINQTIIANSSATRAPGPPLERKASTKVAGSSMSGLTMQRNVSSSDVVAQRQRAKEIYNRDLRLAEDLEREKKEREAAAKHSREAAAEQGRQASREWAEKMRMRKMAEGDKGMGIGYGPGGQMGLRG